MAQIVEKPTDYNILLNMLWPDSPLQNADAALKNILDSYPYFSSNSRIFQYIIILTLL